MEGGGFERFKHGGEVVEFVSWYGILRLRKGAYHE
jgi:hypothetical protein